MKRHRGIWIALTLAAAVGVGYWLAGTAVPRSGGDSRGVERGSGGVGSGLVDEDEVKFRSAGREVGFRSDDEALAAGGLAGQRALIFRDRESMERFLAKLGDRVRLLGRLDGLNALHVGFLDPEDLAALLDGDEEVAMIFPASVPNPQPGGIQDGVRGVGGDLLKLLGITVDNALWGKGVKVAVLDTGISLHPAFAGRITSLDLVPLSGDPSALNGHGTAVASLVAGKGGLTPGVAPGADLLSVRVANDSGESNSFLIAKGILAAVDAGASLINISLGSYGDSVLVRNAIAYARDAGVVIVAAAGNEGLDRLAYPAANDGVIAVGAVDARGTPLAFSNAGEGLAASAPGLDVNAAWTGGDAVWFTGTSASAPVVTGAIAAAMSQGGALRLSAQQAADLVLAKLDDGGAPGADPLLGGGTVNVGRVVNAGTPGIFDAAVASNHVLPPTAEVPYPILQVVIQNRGTETLLNAGVTVQTAFGSTPLNITTLAPDQIRSFSIPLNGSGWNIGQTFEFDTSVRLSSGQTDANPANNRRVDSFVPPNP